MVKDRSLTDPAQYPTLEEREDVYHTNLKTKYVTGIVVSDGSYSVGTMGATDSYSSGTYGSKQADGHPSTLAVDRTWKIKDDEGNDWYIPLFQYG